MKKSHCYVLFFTALCAACSSFDSPSDLPVEQIITINYGGFRLQYDCNARTALRYEYRLTRDSGHFSRPPEFMLDPAFPLDCAQQYTSASYAGIHPGYDRGHLVTSNHMDYDATYIRRANYMSNIVPQVSSFNRGIWVDAENVAECYRDLAPLDVYGGVVYGRQPAELLNDYYLRSHGIRTPEFFWKSIVTTDPASGAVKAISWYIPNIENLGPLDSYIVSIDDLERLLGAGRVGIAVASAVKQQKPAHTWPQPPACDLSVHSALTGKSP
jgi:endonuclease G